MRRGRFLLLIALILILSAVGIFAAIYLNRGLGGGGGGGVGVGDGQAGLQATAVPVTATPEPVVEIIAAAQNLERGMVIPTEAVMAVPWPTQMVPPSGVTDPSVIVGARARYTIQQGEPIFSTMVVTNLLGISPTGSDAAAMIPPGYVGISLPYDRDLGVAYGVRDGDHVNVLVSWAIIDLDVNFQSALPNQSTVLSPPNPDGLLPIPPSLVAVVNSAGGTTPNVAGRGETDPTTGEDFYVVPAEPQRPRLVSQSVIQDAIVLHMGEFGPDKPAVVEPTATPLPEGTEQAPPPATATPAPPDIVTLVVSPQDALVLNYVNRLADRYPGSVVVTLALRSAGDTSRVETESVTLQYMFDRYKIALPAKLSYGLEMPAVPPATAPTAP